MTELTPRQIVAELDKYVIGQDEAKRAVAVALRNRYRRKKLPPEIAREIIPKNILMMGPTGVGKTEIARRLARFKNSSSDSPGSLLGHRLGLLPHHQLVGHLGEVADDRVDVAADVAHLGELSGLDL